MTKKEKNLCEIRMDNAILKALNSKEEYEKYERLKKAGDEVEAEIALRRADQETGYAEGVNDLLVSLGFKHEKMKTLSELL